MLIDYAMRIWTSNDTVHQMDWSRKYTLTVRLTKMCQVPNLRPGHIIATISPIILRLLPSPHLSGPIAPLSPALDLSY
jgi:hypothetical protein